MYVTHGLLLILAALLLWGLVWAIPKKSVISLLFVVVPLCPPMLALSWSEYKWTTLEDRLTDVAVAVAETDEAEVKCERIWGAFFNATNRDGFVSNDVTGELGNLAVLSYDSCRRVQQWIALEDKTEATLEQVTAVHVLTHEFFHIRKVRAEDVTECYAVQNDWQTVQGLGGTRQEAETFQTVYYRSVYPRLNDTYYSSECRDDGLYDLEPGVQNFPPKPDTARVTLD